ncbi:hypothetical protein CP996_16770, partial [Escherichia coli]
MVKIIRGSEIRNNITKGFFFIYKLLIKDVILSLFILMYECLFYYGCYIYTTSIFFRGFSFLK